MHLKKLMRINISSKADAVLALWILGLLVLNFFADRTSFGLLSLWSFLAFATYFLLTGAVEWTEKRVNQLILAGLLMRLLSVFAFPRLSDDIYRFFWDGSLSLNGISPFAFLPRYIFDSGMLSGATDPTLFENLNSKDYYSVYPPVCQFVFAAAYVFSPKSMYGFAVLLKAFLFCCECGTLYYLKRMNVGPKNLLIYALNPLLVLEMCGNAHFEAAMLFFFVAALYHLNVHNSKEQKPQILLGALLIALSVASKLLTLIFLPFLLRHLGWKKSVGLVLLLTLFSTLLFAPFYDDHFIAHFMSSVSLYFQNFEFNASLYYMFKWVGNAIYGYTPAHLIAAFSNLLFLGGGALLFFSKRDFFSAAFLLATIYLLLQRAVHPWYICTLVLLSTFVPWRYGILWSGLVMLSYSHYHQNIYHENSVLLFVEYVVLFGFMLRELFFTDNRLTVHALFDRIRNRQ